MSNAAVRLRDFVKATCDVPSGPFFTASSDTFTNGRGQVRLRDKSVPGIAISGSATVFVNGRPAIRLKDRVQCGRIVTASSDHFIGD